VVSAEVDAADGILGTLFRCVELGGAGGGRRVIPLLTVVFDFGENASDIHVGIVVELIIDRAGGALAGAVVLILAVGIALVEDFRWRRRGVNRWIDLVDTASIPVVGETEQRAEPTGGTKPFAQSKPELIVISSAQDRVAPAQGAEILRRFGS